MSGLMFWNKDQLLAHYSSKRKKYFTIEIILECRHGYVYDGSTRGKIPNQYGVGGYFHCRDCDLTRLIIKSVVYASFYPLDTKT